MADDGKDEERACRFCRGFVPVGAVYCVRCGAHLDPAAFPRLQESLDLQRRKIRIYTALFAAGAVSAYYAGQIGVMLIGIRGNPVAAGVVALLGIGLLFYVGVKADKATRGIGCPACGEIISQWLLKQDVSHCYRCGTRILAGRRSRVAFPDRLSASVGAAQCGFCGEPIGENHLYCLSCGSSLAREIRHEDGGDKAFADDPVKRRCPACGRPTRGIPRREFNYCPGCGVRLRP